MDWSVHFPAYVDHETQSTASAAKGPTSKTEDVTTAQSLQQAKATAMTKSITVADIGCGFGGLLVALSPLLPDDLILGLEIRAQVTEYVYDRIQALRAQAQAHTQQDKRSQSNDTRSDSGNNHNSRPLPSAGESLSLERRPVPVPGPGAGSGSDYQNISALRTNSMKFLPNLFPRASIRHIFLCFPDPHFKQRKHKARIVSETLVAEYAYILEQGGCVWCITDVEELSGWMEERFRDFGRTTTITKDSGGGEGGSEQGGGDGLFERVQIPAEGEESAWPDAVVGRLVRCIREETEEGKKVTRNGGRKFVGVWRRRGDPKWPGEEEEE